LTKMLGHRGVIYSASRTFREMAGGTAQFADPL
jgi:hypothetical protein